MKRVQEAIQTIGSRDLSCLTGASLLFGGLYGVEHGGEFGFKDLMFVSMDLIAIVSMQMLFRRHVTAFLKDENELHRLAVTHPEFCPPEISFFVGVHGLNASMLALRPMVEATFQCYSRQMLAFGLSSVVTGFIIGAVVQAVCREFTTS